MTESGQPQPLRVFITGASSGIGEALARHYGGLGATLGVTGRRADRLREVVAPLAAPCATYPVDVRDAIAMQDAAADFMTRFGVPDIVIANAGVSHGTLTEYAADIEVFEEIVDVNVFGMVRTFQPFIEPMRAARAGRLVGIASVAGVRGLPGAAAYSASKSAAITYLESLRVELGASGVRVVCVMPGYIDTPMTRINPYPMPFLLQADDAAARIARVIASGRARAVVPWQMAIVARLLGWMPIWLYDALFARAPRKPRKPRKPK